LTLLVDQVSRSSCHNYFMNVTDFGYNLVVDLDTQSPSSQLFLLVKASPILRHSLEDEHNYASYYQFKKQGDHHGVVVTSEHLSPGRWYIGVCNYVQEVALFDDKRAASHHSSSASDDAEYTVVATLNRTKQKLVNTEEGVGAEEETALDMDKRGFASVDLEDEGASCAASGGGACPNAKKQKSHDKKSSAPRTGQKRKLTSNPSVTVTNSGERSGFGRRRRAEEEEERSVVAGAGHAAGTESSGKVDPETLFWAVRAEALEKELERVREEMEIVKDELTGVLSHTSPTRPPKSPLARASHLHADAEEDDGMLQAEEAAHDQMAYTHPPHPAAARRRRKLSALPGKRGMEVKAGGRSEGRGWREEKRGLVSKRDLVVVWGAWAGRQAGRQAARQERGERELGD